MRFNPGDTRYYLAESSFQNVGSIDAMTLRVVGDVQSGLGAYSVAADPANNHIFVPVAGPDPACPTGCRVFDRQPRQQRIVAPR